VLVVTSWLRKMTSLPRGGRRHAEASSTRPPGEGDRGRERAES
jgi:hypothetical protein